MRSRFRFALALGLLSALALPTASGATVTSVTMNGSVSPTPVGQTKSGESLSFGFDAVFSGGFSPSLYRTVFHFDNDISFDTSGLPQCNPASINGMTRAQALALCGAAQVGSGSMVLHSVSVLNGVVTVFNGTPSGGLPRVIFHVDVNNGSVDFVGIGTLEASSRGGDFGTEINLFWPPVGPGTTHFAATLNNIALGSGSHYVSATCTDPNLHLDFASDFTYWDASTGTASATQPCTGTGRRAAALKKCKKKHSKAKRRKCRKRANLLPV